MSTVSVIIPCFNQARFLSDSVGSVLAQTHEDWECVIVNNGSTDNTEEVGKAYAAKDGRIRCINHSRPGVSGARNRGLAEARGQYIQFLDADDVIMPTKLERQLQLVEHGVGLVLAYCDYWHAPEDDLRAEVPGYVDPRFRSNNSLKELILRWETEISIPIHCFLLDARFFTDHKIRFDERLQNHVDWDCWIEVFALRPRVLFLDAKLAVYRVHSASMCRNMANMRRGFLKAIAKQRARFSRDEEMLAALTWKRREIEWVYRHYAPLNPLRRFLGSVARAVLPEKWIRQFRMRRDRSALGADHSSC
jgi:glycosyltransferase involved in cell wall biosynthesis